MEVGIEVLWEVEKVDTGQLLLVTGSDLMVFYILKSFILYNKIPLVQSYQTTKFDFPIFSINRGI